ncbi:MAG: large repetitive protein [Solirubrobacteraceae bacterium]|nr:large repetitive protein [Solirubrobacteraceae bacterium]
MLPESRQPRSQGGALRRLATAFVLCGALAAAYAAGPTPAAVAAPGTLTLSAPASAAISESGGSTTVQVTRTGGSDGAVGATIGVGGTAGGGERTVSPLSVSFAAGDTAPKTVTVSALPDSIVDGNKTVILSLTGGTGGVTLDPGTRTVTIVDGVAPGTLTLTAPASAQIAEAGGSTTLQVTRTGGSVGGVGATISIGGSAGSGDRVVSPVSVNFADGDTTAKTVTVTATLDSVLEPNETVDLSLANGSGGVALDPATRTVTIIDGSPAPTTLTPTPTPAPTPGPGAPGRVTSSVTSTWRWFKHYTTVARLTVNRIPARGIVVVKCRGRGCPFASRRLTFRNAARSRSLTGLFNFTRHRRGHRPQRVISRLLVGTAIEIQMAAPGQIGRWVRFNVRSAKRPTVTRGCLAIGTTAKVAC